MLVRVLAGFTSIVFVIYVRIMALPVFRWFRDTFFYGIPHDAVKALEGLGLELVTDGSVEHHFATLNGVRLHYVQCGPSDGPLMVFLHGFPECWISWRHQLKHFSSKGYNCVALDQRGYNLSEKPHSVDDYRVDALVDDVAALIQELGYKDATVVGHDWGGFVGWMLAMTYPKLVNKYVACNIPHPLLFLKGFATNETQMKRSWYIFFFQLPFLPERMVAGSRDGLRDFYLKALKNREQRDKESATLIATAVTRRGTPTAAVNWYRANIFRIPDAKARQVQANNRKTKLTMPCLIVWGESDEALGKELTYGTDKYVDDLTLHYIPKCSHWVQQDAPKEVCSAIDSFIEAHQ